MKKMLFPVTQKNPRMGEGSAVLLRDGRVFLIYSKFTGTGDADHSDLAGGILDPVTGTFSDERLLFAESHYLNQMSVSLERLADGSIGCVFIRKLGASHDLGFFTRSCDECRSWSTPRVISYIDPSDYFVVNNDRLRQLSSGRLVLPVCPYPDGFKTIPSYLAVWYSDDLGTTWHASEKVPPCAAPPRPEPYLAETDWAEVCRYPYREPGSSRLWCVFNDRSGVVFGDAEKKWGWRTPLTLSYSDDNGHSWTKYKQIEDDSHNYCYTSMTFLGKTLLLTYYESENRSDGTRRNLAGLKMQTVEL